MNAQISIDFDAPALFQRRSSTSLAAAVAALPNAGTARRRVYECIADSANGATDDEIQVRLNMNPSTQRPRRVELVDAKLIRDSSVRRRTRGGREAVVWMVA
jgi:transcription initiation factor IIE alpha subunit